MRAKFHPLGALGVWEQMFTLVQECDMQLGMMSSTTPTSALTRRLRLPRERDLRANGRAVCDPAIPYQRQEVPVACPDWITANRNRVEQLRARLEEWRAFEIITCSTLATTEAPQTRSYGA